MPVSCWPSMHKNTLSTFYRLVVLLLLLMASWQAYQSWSVCILDTDYWPDGVDSCSGCPFKYHLKSFLLMSMVKRDYIKSNLWKGIQESFCFIKSIERSIFLYLGQTRLLIKGWEGLHANRNMGNQGQQQGCVDIGRFFLAFVKPIFDMLIISLSYF